MQRAAGRPCPAAPSGRRPAHAVWAALAAVSCRLAWRVPGRGVRGTARRRGPLRGGRRASGPVQPGPARLRCGRCRRPGASAAGRAPRTGSGRRRFRARWPMRRPGCRARPGRPSSWPRRSCWAQRHHGAIAADDLVVAESLWRCAAFGSEIGIGRQGVVGRVSGEGGLHVSSWCCSRHGPLGGAVRVVFVVCQRPVDGRRLGCSSAHGSCAVNHKATLYLVFDAYVGTTYSVWRYFFRLKIWPVLC
jgi:hypothetical protein